MKKKRVLCAVMTLIFCSFFVSEENTTISYSSSAYIDELDISVERKNSKKIFKHFESKRPIEEIIPDLYAFDPTAAEGFAPEGSKILSVSQTENGIVIDYRENGIRTIVEYYKGGIIRKTVRKNDTIYMNFNDEEIVAWPLWGYHRRCGFKKEIRLPEEK